MQIRPRLSEKEWSFLKNFRKAEGVLFIGDLHAPFIKKGYLDFCLEVNEKYNCEHIIFAGDILDNHYSSYHETDPDGHSASQELQRAKLMIREWYSAFPVARVCIGNHDRLPARKAMTSGISNQWIKPIADVVNTPGWNFQTEFIIDNVKYVHGEARKARNRARDDLISVCQGHYHSESYVEHYFGENYSIFALQVGCGIDRRSYSMAYSKHGKKPHLNCAVILEHGTLPIIETMKLGL